MARFDLSGFNQVTNALLGRIEGQLAAQLSERSLPFVDEIEEASHHLAVTFPMPLGGPLSLPLSLARSLASEQKRQTAMHVEGAVGGRV